MGLATGTLITGTEFAGTKKLLTLTGTVVSADDTMTLTTATHGITSLDSIIGCVVHSGTGVSLSRLVPSIVSASGMSINVLAYGITGSATSTFGQSYTLTVLGNH